MQNRLCKYIKMPQETFNEFWNKKKRPAWDVQGVRIDYETFKPRSVSTSERERKKPRITGKRPTTISGIVFPTKTRGRPAAPTPLSGHSTTHYPQDKGHIMALELGGPNARKNIFPQAQYSNRHGNWRDHETKVLLKAQNIFRIKKPLPPEDWADFKCPRIALQLNIQLEYGGRDPAIPKTLTFNVYEVTIGSAPKYTIERKHPPVIRETLENYDSIGHSNYTLENARKKRSRSNENKQSASHKRRCSEENNLTRNKS